MTRLLVYWVYVDSDLRFALDVARPVCAHRRSLLVVMECRDWRLPAGRGALPGAVAFVLHDPARYLVGLVGVDVVEVAFACRDELAAAAAVSRPPVGAHLGAGGEAVAGGGADSGANLGLGGLPGSIAFSLGFSGILFSRRLDSFGDPLDQLGNDVLMHSLAAEF